MPQRIIIALIALLGISEISGQGVLSEESKTILTNEKTFGLFLNSNGLGADYRFAKFVTGRKSNLFDFSFNYVNHPKEYSTIVQTTLYSKRYVFGKENIFWEIQGAIGKQNELFIKRDYSGISIRMFYTGGISIGFKKPIYYDIFSFDDRGYPYVTDHLKFDPSIHPDLYGGKSSFFMGFNELKVIPGLTLEGGFEFEYSEREPVLHSIEAGIATTVYPVRINIMADDNPQWFFFKMYVAYRFGSIVDFSPEGKLKTRKERRTELKDAMEGQNILRFHP